jgi:general secretion pathway protein M
MPLKEYWFGLQLSERRTLLLGALAVIIMFFYLAVWEPLAARNAGTTQRISELQQQLVWMQQAALEVKRLSRGRPVAGSREQSLLAVADSSARKLQLGNAINRIQPDGEHTVRVWLEGAPFDFLLAWLDELALRGVHVVSLVIERTPISGVVNARLELESR